MKNKENKEKKIIKKFFTMIKKRQCGTMILIIDKFAVNHKG